MDFRFEQNLTIEQKQQLAMTPALVQAIQVLQLSSQELESFIQEHLNSNPVLERSYCRDSSYTDPASYEEYTAAEETLTDHLMVQLEITADSKKQEVIGTYIIECIDQNGYLTSPISELTEKTHSEKKDIMKALRLIQTFDPYGVGARTVAECLMIQLRHAGLWNDTYQRLLQYHFDDISANRLKVISKSMDLPVHQIQEMVDILKKLDPHPGLQFSSGKDNKYIIPDIYVEESEGDYIVKLNDNSTPTLTVSSYYSQLLKESLHDPEVYKYLKERINAATWLINSIQQRKQTIYNIAAAIVDFQLDFFRKGKKHLKAMTLKQIAEIVQVHESTVSRTVNGKYLQCHDGIFELKYFFASGDTDGTSSISIKSYISDIISGEDPYHPYSDEKISHLLKEKGIEISRRTVAKYREEINILSSSKRRRY